MFVRRAYMDVIGTQPSAREASSFILSRDPDKRAKLIDRLLARDEFADYWAMKWSDLLRVKAEFPIDLWPNAAQAYYHWIRTPSRRISPMTNSCVTCSRPAAAISRSARPTFIAPCKTATRKASRKRWR